MLLRERHFLKLLKNNLPQQQRSQNPAYLSRALVQSLSHLYQGLYEDRGPLVNGHQYQRETPALSPIARFRPPCWTRWPLPILIRLQPQAEDLGLVVTEGWILQTTRRLPPLRQRACHRRICLLASANASSAGQDRVGEPLQQMPHRRNFPRRLFPTQRARLRASCQSTPRRAGPLVRQQNWPRVRLA